MVVQMNTNFIFQGGMVINIINVILLEFFSTEILKVKLTSSLVVA